MKYGFNEKGFSLIEILVTISIIAIVLAIAVPTYFGYIRASKTTEAKTNLQALGLLLEQRRSDSGTYCPATATNYTYTENDAGAVTAETIRIVGGVNYLINFRPKLATTGAAVLYDYTVNCPAAGNNLTFTITAAPAAGRGAPTGNLTLTETGAKTGWQ